MKTLFSLMSALLISMFFGNLTMITVGFNQWFLIFVGIFVFFLLCYLKLFKTGGWYAAAAGVALSLVAFGLIAAKALHNIGMDQIPATLIVALYYLCGFVAVIVVDVVTEKRDQRTRG